MENIINSYETLFITDLSNGEEATKATVNKFTGLIGSNGEIVEVFYPNNETRIRATGRLNCVGRYTEEGGFLVNGSTHIAAGQYVDVTTEYVTVTLCITEIDIATDTTTN